MMRQISVEAELSKINTNRVRATAITLWSDAEIPSRHIQQISEHKRAETLIHYNNRMSTNQLKSAPMCSRRL